MRYELDVMRERVQGNNVGVQGNNVGVQGNNVGVQGNNVGVQGNSMRRSGQQLELRVTPGNTSPFTQHN